MPGVEQVRSKTIRGAVELSLFFAEGTDMAQAHPLVLARVAEARSSLPPEVELIAERVLPTGFPILSFNVEGPLPAASSSTRWRSTPCGPRSPGCPAWAW